MKIFSSRNITFTHIKLLPRRAASVCLGLISRALPKGKMLRIPFGFNRGLLWEFRTTRRIYELGLYDTPKQALLMRTVAFLRREHQQIVAYDAGAHVGFFTLLLARLVGPRGMVYAFEPLPENLRVLKKHVAMNHFMNVRIFEAGLSNHEGGGNILIDSGLPTELARVVDTGGIPIRLVTLDALLARREITPPRLIKMNIEGEELRALSGGINMLRAHHPIIFISIHDIDLETLEKTFALLHSLGYTLFDFNGRLLLDAAAVVRLHQTGKCGECIAIPASRVEGLRPFLWKG